jgi:hypothetical protein
VNYVVIRTAGSGISVFRTSGRVAAGSSVTLTVSKDDNAVPGTTSFSVAGVTVSVTIR